MSLIILQTSLQETKDQLHEKTEELRLNQLNHSQEKESLKAGFEQQKQSFEKDIEALQQKLDEQTQEFNDLKTKLALSEKEIETYIHLFFFLFSSRFQNNPHLFNKQLQRNFQRI